jgi:hypothetical protein
VETFALRATIPYVRHIVAEKFNWYEERARVFAECATQVETLQILTVDSCNKCLATFFAGKFPALVRIHVPFNCLQNDSVLMLIKAVDEGMPALEELDLSHVLQQVNTAKVVGTPAKKK